MVAAWTAGMGLFILLVFGYYAAYDMVVPADNRVFLWVAAGLLGLAAAAARWVGGARTLSATGRRPRAAGRVGAGPARVGRAIPGRAGLVPVGWGRCCCWPRRWPG